jgi:hypothetical protein
MNKGSCTYGSLYFCIIIKNKIDLYLFLFYIRLMFSQNIHIINNCFAAISATTITTLTTR